jgi:hypothetical protein
MTPSEWFRVAIYCFMAGVASLFSYRMWLRARYESGKFAFPPHWYHIVSLYLSSWVVLGFGISVRILCGEFTSEHTRFLMGLAYQGYALFFTVTALYYWVKT